MTGMASNAINSRSISGLGRVFLIIICPLLVCFSCRKSDDNLRQRREIIILPDQELWNARIVFTKNERITSILDAWHIIIYERTGLTVADSSFVLDIFNAEGEHSSQLTADSGVVAGEDSLEAYRNVVVVSDSGVTLSSERLFWNRAKKTVRTDTFVVLTTETDTLYGDSLISDETLQNWQVFNPRGKSARALKKNTK